MCFVCAVCDHQSKYSSKNCSQQKYIQAKNVDFICLAECFNFFHNEKGIMVHVHTAITLYTYAHIHCSTFIHLMVCSCSTLTDQSPYSIR